MNQKLSLSPWLSLVGHRSLFNRQQSGYKAHQIIVNFLLNTYKHTYKIKYTVFSHKTSRFLFTEKSQFNASKQTFPRECMNCICANVVSRHFRLVSRLDNRKSDKYNKMLFMLLMKQTLFESSSKYCCFPLLIDISHRQPP